LGIRHCLTHVSIMATVAGDYERLTNFFLGFFRLDCPVRLRHSRRQSAKLMRRGNHRFPYDLSLQ
jgi:hypothetical protein